MIRKYGLYAAWVLAFMGLIISLYFSEIRRLEPCHLCWYQRICLYPLVLILGIATYRNDLSISLYTFPMVVIGFFFSIYQILIQEIPDWNPIDMCGAGPSCSERIDIGLGFISIPMLSALLFVALSLLLGGILKERSRLSKN